MEEALGAPSGDLKMLKRGETYINMTFRRSMSGLTLAIKTHPSVEEFFRNLSTGELADTRAAGRYWTAIAKDAPLMAYNLAEGIPLLHIDSRRRARFDWLGRQLITPQSADHAAEGGELGGRSSGVEVNLSFLRLAGIGDGAGVTFQLKGVYSDLAVQEMHDHIAEAAKRFYQIYMKPINLNVSIVTTEWALLLVGIGLGLLGS